jgi:uncharacterized membrane protein YhaH (DUF805 family)
MKFDFKQFYFSAQGRVNRRQWWLRFMLPVFVITLLLAFIDVAIGTHIAETYTSTDNGSTSTTTIEIKGLLTSLFGLAVFIPAILVDIKRWHDRDKSGWWMLIALIPIIGAIWLLIELGFLKGTDGPNRFGPPVTD